MSIKDWFKFIGVSLFWGSSFLWIKIAVHEIPVLTLVMFRILISLTVVGLTVVSRRETINLRPYLGSLIVLGLVNVIFPFVLIAISEKQISSGMAAIINSTQPLFTLVIASLVIPEEMITTKKITGLILGFSGVFILVSNQVSSQSIEYLGGLLTMLFATICYAAGTIYVRSRLNNLPSPVQVMGQMVSALIIITPMAFIMDSPIILPQQPITWAAVLYLGLFVSGLGNLLFFSLLKSIGPTRSSLTIYMLPLIAVSLSIFVLKENFEWQMAVGASIIITGIAMVNSRLPTKILLIKYMNQLMAIFRS